MDDGLKPLPDNPFEDAFRKTAVGMAHLAGSGPTGKKCGSCAHFHRSDNYASQGHCGRYEELVRVPRGQTRRHELFARAMLACRHYVGR